MLKLAAWLTAMGYFKKVNFIFLIVGHTKNAADSLFNSLKHEYHKKNLFTMEGLLDYFGVSNCVTIVPTLLMTSWTTIDYSRISIVILRGRSK